MDLFEVVLCRKEAPNRLLVVAADEREARELASRRGRAVEAVRSHGGFVVRGRSRVIGSVEDHITE